jgi:hypothetical protein
LGCGDTAGSAKVELDAAMQARRDAAQALADAEQALPDAEQALPDAAQALADAEQALPDAAKPLPDAAQALPDAAKPLPDAAQALPDAAKPLPDAAQALPDAAQALPDAAQALPDAAPPPVPDAAPPPVPDAAPPPVPDAALPLPDATRLDAGFDPLPVAIETPQDWANFEATIYAPWTEFFAECCSDRERNQNRPTGFDAFDDQPVTGVMLAPYYTILVRNGVTGFVPAEAPRCAAALRAAWPPPGACGERDFLAQPLSTARAWDLPECQPLFPLQAPNGRTCMGLLGCVADQVCENRCVPAVPAPQQVGDTCNTVDNHCPADLRCDPPTDLCEPLSDRGGYCDFDADCLPDLRCSVHACTPFDPAGACTDRCPEGQSCASMLCQAERPLGAACDAATEPLCDETCKFGHCTTFCDGTGTLRGACAAAPDFFAEAAFDGFSSYVVRPDLNALNVVSLGANHPRDVALVYRLVLPRTGAYQASFRDRQGAVVGVVGSARRDCEDIASAIRFAGPIRGSAGDVFAYVVDARAAVALLGEIRFDFSATSPLGAACVDNGACDPGLYCAGGRCVEAGGIGQDCQSDDACAPGLACGVNDPFPPYRCSPIP